MVLEFLKKATTQLKKDVAGGLNLLSATFVKPTKVIPSVAKLIVGKKETKQAAAKTIVSAVKQTKALPLSTQIKKTLQSTVVAGVGVVAAPIVTKGVIKAAPTVAKELGKRAIASPLKTAAAGLIGVPFAIGVLSKPKAREVLAETPKSSFEKGKAAVDILTGEKKIPETVTKGLKTAGLIGAGAVIGAGAIAVGSKVVSALKKPKETELMVNPLMSATPVASTIPQTTVGEVEKPVVEKATTTQPLTRVSQKVTVNQKVYKAGSIDVRADGRRTRTIKRKRFKRRK